MRQDTQASRTATNKQTVQQEMRIHQEKRKMDPLPSSMSKKFCNNRENSPETEKKTELVLGKSFRQGKVFSTSELAASDMIQHKQLKIKTPEFSHCKIEAADLEDLGPGQSSELIAKRAILFKERGRSYLAHKKNKTNQYSKNLYLKQEVIATSSQVEPSDKTADKDKHFTTSEVAAGCNKMKIQSQHLSTSEVASGRTVQPSSHLSTSEVAAKNRGAEKRLKLLSKDGTLVQKNGESVKVCNLSTSEVAVNHKSTSAGSTSGRSLYDKEVVRQRIKSRKAENRNKQLEEQRIERGKGHGAKSEEELKHIEEERRREEEMVRERRRTEIACIDKWVNSKFEDATPPALCSGPKLAIWNKNQPPRPEKTPGHGEKSKMAILVLFGSRRSLGEKETDLYNDSCPTVFNLYDIHTPQTPARHP